MGCCNLQLLTSATMASVACRAARRKERDSRLKAFLNARGKPELKHMKVGITCQLALAGMKEI